MTDAHSYQSYWDEDPIDPPVEAGHRWVVVETPSCAELRDLVSLEEDFVLARRFLLEYVERNNAWSIEDPSRFDSLWIAAFTMYGRAFGNGARHAARPSTDIFNDDQRGTHAYVLDVRNKFVAHAVNAFDQARVFAVLTDSAFKPRGIVGVGESHTRLSHLVPGRATEVAELCDLQLEHINGRIALLRNQVAAELREGDLASLYERPSVAPAEIDQSRPAQRRP